MKRRYLTALLSVVLSLPGISAFAAETKLSGGMIQFVDANLPKPEHPNLPFEWANVVADMSDLKMNRLVIQRMKVKNNDSAGSKSDFYFVDPATKKPYNNDPLKLILEKAGEKNIDVFVGLFSDESINANNSRLLNATDQSAFHAMLDEQAKADLELAKTLWESYSPNASFKGWYLPIEPWNFKWEEWKNDEFNFYLKKVSTGLAEFKKNDVRLPVMWAPHFKSNYATPVETKALYKKLLNGAKIDVLAVQDGFGAEYGRTTGQASTYFTSFKEACNELPSDVNASHKIDLWCDTEIYQSQGVPTTIAKLKEHICAVRGLVNTIICWDFFHYMTDKVPDNAANATYKMIESPLAARKELHDAYKSEFVDKAYTCP